MPAVLAHEPLIRLVAFLAILAAMAIAEIAAPRRRREIPRLVRWSNNLGLVIVDTLALRLAFPVLAVGVALSVDAHGFGLLNWLDVPEGMAIVIAFIVLDLAIYGQHVAFHAVPALWRVHRMHHADLEIDVTTGLRFHPIEILLSMAFKLAVVALIGAPAVAVLLFEVVLNAMAMFNHANLRLPEGIDRLLRLVVVTPDMHRVHHSIERRETDSNYGFNLSVWDRLFKTYIPQPKAGHDRMTIGLPLFRTRRDLWLDRMLIQPFRGNADAGASTPPPREREQHLSS
ncbi:sterol desaturase family protein [Amorphus sp. 3PC139-8]|uniref:sterol desaturase family protein n=1 Tax=Amorphus sp. 3PC139-8 TaxID=2735676 RepID=UPI00345CC1A3